MAAFQWIYVTLKKKNHTDFRDKKKRKLRKVRPKSEYFPSVRKGRVFPTVTKVFKNEEL